VPSLCRLSTRGDLSLRASTEHTASRNNATAARLYFEASFMLNNQTMDRETAWKHKRSRSSADGCTRSELLLLVRDSGPDATTHAKTFSSKGYPTWNLALWSAANLGPDRQENLMKPPTCPCTPDATTHPKILVPKTVLLGIRCSGRLALSN